jgi:starvation-inducible DNA-binding protein
MTTERRSDQVQEFSAPPSLPQDLQKVLVDLIELHLQGKQAHWNLVSAVRTECARNAMINGGARR